MLETFAARKDATALLVALACVLLWIIQSPYGGLSHDARLYSLIAVAKAYPGNLDHDIFVQFGSQGDFSAFTLIHTALVARLDVETAALLITLVGSCLWLLAAGFFARRVAPAGWALPSFAALLLLPKAYGIYGALTLGEVFATPRPAAEAFCMLALGMALAKRPVLAAGSLLLAMALHPLLAMPVCLVAGLIAFPGLQGLRAMALAALASALVLALALLNPLGPLQLMPADWFEVVRYRSPYLFPDLWDGTEWARVAWALSTALTLLRVTGDSNPLGVLARTAPLVASIGLLLAYVLGSLFPVQIVVQGQAWRWLWPVTLLALASLPWLASELWSRGPVARSALLFVVSGLLMYETPGAAVAVLAPAALWVGTDRSQGFQRIVAVVALVTAALGAITCLSLLHGNLVSTPGSQGTPGLLEVTRAATRGGILTTAVALAVITAGSRRVRLLFASATFAIALVLGRDIADEWSRSTIAEGHPEVFAAWRAVIRPGDNVYWPDQLEPTWFLLQRPSYLSREQTAGSLFSDAAASEMWRRAHAMSTLAPLASTIRVSTIEPFVSTLSAASITAACKDEALGYVVAPESFGLPEAAPAVTARSPWITSRIHLIPCAALRSGGLT